MTSAEGNNNQQEPEFINLADYIRARLKREWESIKEGIIKSETAKKDRTEPICEGSRVFSQAA